MVATLALFVALGGSSFAAPARDAAKHLITGKSIKNNSISSTDIKNNSVKSTDVRNGSLLKKDFKAGQLPSGPAGARGPAGATGTVGRVTYVVRSTILSGTSGSVTAPCASGQYATGGSAFASGDASVQLTYSGPITGLLGGWQGDASKSAVESGSMTVFAICAALPMPAVDGALP